jgi:predicted nucleotidyltransferase
MAEIPDKIETNIRKYIELLDNKGFKIDSAYIFGSYASGYQNEWSDIDLAIFSDKFEGNRMLDKEKILGLNRLIDYRLSPLPLNPTSIIDSLFVQCEVIQKGIKVF